jgi:type VI secretion system secreted protein Hcp
MAETVHLTLTANGVRIEGESTQTTLNRADTIECVSFENNVALAVTAFGGAATGRRRHKAIVIRKRIDKSSPLLAKALVENQTVEGIFRFYRPDSAGETEEFFSIEIGSGRVSSLSQLVASTLDPATTALPPLEEVAFVYDRIVWTDPIADIRFEDRVSGSP